MRRVYCLLLGLCGVVSALADDGPPTEVASPLEPAAALQSFDLEPGLRAELVAAEPLVVAPVAMAFDERGRLFVAENRGYPTGPKEGEPPLGRIALLEDTDLDGRMDRRSEFATGLTFPNGVLPWQGGLIVTCAPEILFLKDTDNDGQADHREVWFTGFSTSGSTQLRVSHPTLSLDNWIYVTSGLTGGSVTSMEHPDRPPVELKRTDFRFRPDRSGWEAADGGAQFGLTFDDFGRRFICYNRVQVQHVVLPSSVLRRHPQLAFSETVQNCPADVVAEPLKGHGAAARLFPISSNVTTADSHAGTFTAACAVTVFRGTGLPERYHGGAFSCDPTGNLVHFDRLEPYGATFLARRATEGREFLASRDNWFRPVFLASGPDSALYVCDMYRKTIEHPDYLPVEIRKHTDFESGKNMGRIWRIVRDDRPTGQQAIDLVRLTTPELVAALSDPSGWQRDTVQRLLLARDAGELGPLLKAHLLLSKTTPEVIAPLLFLLEQCGALDDVTLKPLLQNGSAEIRELALQLVERRIAAEPRWDLAVYPLALDEAPRVRFQLAQTLGAIPDLDRRRSAVMPLAAIAVQGADDRWTRAAAMSASLGVEADLLVEVLRSSQSVPLPADLCLELGRLVGATQSLEKLAQLGLEFVIETYTSNVDVNAALLTGLIAGARNRLQSQADAGLLLALLKPEAGSPAAEAVQRLIGNLSELATNTEAAPAARRVAIGLLADTSYAAAGELLIGLLSPQEPVEVQTAAVRALGQFRDEQVAAQLLDRDRFVAYSPTMREEVLATVVSQPHHLAGLLTALEQGDLPLTSVDALRRRQLLSHRDASIKQRAEKLFGTVSGDRAKVYEDYKEVADRKGSPKNGVAVFKKACATCHRLDREGFAVGPDLFGIRNQPKAAILLHILVPDHEITQGFTAYTVVLKDGRTLTGLLAAETPTSITLRQPQGKEDVLLRSDLDEIVASPLSLMPQGVEKNLTREEFADLLAYLKGEAE